MRSPSFFRFALPVLLLLTASTFSHAAVQSRISSVNTSSRVAMEHTVSPRALAGRDLGAAPGDQKLTSLTLFFNRTAAQQSALDQLLIDLQNPSSPRYHQWITPEQFGAQFGLSAQDLAKVTQWLASQGLTVTSTARGSNFVTFSGTIAQIQQAFDTSIHTVMVDGETHISNVSEPDLPAGIAGVVSTITGLNDLKLKSRARVSQVAAPASLGGSAQPNTVRPQFTSNTSGSHYVTPGDFYKIYDVSPIFSSGYNGSGITIAVMGQTDISISDVTAFRNAASASSTNFPSASFPASNLPSVFCIQTNAAGTVTTAGIVTSPASAPTCVGSSSSDLAEAQLDVEWSGAVAPAAKILYVDSSDVLNISLVQAINRNLAPIITISYGLCEPSGGANALAAYNQLFQQANAQGQTIVGPAGDSGATDCDYGGYPAVQGLAVDFPASSPNVTGIGGTMFNEDTGTYWQAASGSDVITSALGYIPETVWNETTATNGLSAGGGGASVLFSKPSWQVGTGVPADSVRDVPDVSLNAAASYEGYIFCSSGSCTNGFRTAAGNLNVVGGTSVGAPSFGGILALIQQQINSKMGNANPTIYGLASKSNGSSIFHDVSTGNNSSPCVAGTPNCPTGGSIGYTATTGYDLATGWGSVDASLMANNWTSVTPAGTIVAGTKTGSTVLVTTNTAVCAVSSGSMVINVAVSNSSTAGSAATPTPSSVVPTGTVTILIDGKAVTGTVTSLGASGTATVTVNTASLTSGSHTIGATYSGDGSYYSSQGILGTVSSTGLFTSTPVDIISSTSADFSITPCTASVTVTRGTTAPGLVLTLTPFKGYSGNVTLALTTGDSVAASYQFSSTTVALSSTTPATTTLTLSAFQSNAVTATGNLRVNISSNRQPFGHVPWYASTSGATVACLLLISLPRRRRLGGLLAVLLSIGAIGAIGCSSSSSTTGTTPTTGTTAATPGTYTLIVTATGTGGQVHTTNVTFTVQ
ncbi:MAG: Multicopper oxidase [Acidobacteriaceae bacterium]|nr:Multicopper oxidase [Acidobacteriaceae bacterium]